MASTSEQHSESPSLDDFDFGDTKSLPFRDLETNKVYKVNSVDTFKRNDDSTAYILYIQESSYWAPSTFEGKTLRYNIDIERPFHLCVKDMGTSLKGNKYHNYAMKQPSW